MAYDIAHLRRVQPGPEIAEYLRRIDDTLPPYGRRSLVHGGPAVRADGHWEGGVVVIEFPDLASARGWYESPAYQAILPLRLQHSDGDAILVEGVPEGYRAASFVAKLGIG